MNFIDNFQEQTKHAFRDESKSSSLFNLTKIYQQIDFNEDENNKTLVTQGNFLWENGIKDTRVIFAPNNQGRFFITWILLIITYKIDI